jgi:hypothetical protein
MGHASYGIQKVSLTDFANAILYSRWPQVSLELHWVAATSRRVSHRIAADLGGTALGGQEACGGVSQKMICTFTNCARGKISAVDLTSDALPFGPLWYDGPQGVTI